MGNVVTDREMEVFHHRVAEVYVHNFLLVETTLRWTRRNSTSKQWRPCSVQRCSKNNRCEAMGCSLRRYYNNNTIIGYIRNETNSTERSSGLLKTILEIPALYEDGKASKGEHLELGISLYCALKTIDNTKTVASIRWARYNILKNCSTSRKTDK